MIYRTLGRTGAKVSAIALGCEGFVGKTQDEAREMVDYAVGNGINFIDVYSSDPGLRSTLGNALLGRRENFVIQAHLCSVWKNGQYERTRDLAETKQAFADLLKRLGTDYIDVGMIHYIDAVDDFHTVFDGGIIEYAKQLKAEGKIRSIGLSSHNPVTARMAVETGLIDVLMFSVNPCYDMQPPDEDVEMLWADERYEKALHNFNSERESLYELCERENVGIDVTKVYAGGDLRIVPSCRGGCHGGMPEHFRDGTGACVVQCHRRGKGLFQSSCRTRKIHVVGALHVLRALCAVPGRD